MKKISALLALIILTLPIIVPFTNKVSTEDCFVQIVSVSLTQASFEIGERLQMNLVYDLYFDLGDPLGIGSVTITVENQAEAITLGVFLFTEMGLDVNKVVNLDISPADWSPNESGQTGRILVDAWVQDSMGTMTDSVEQQFLVQRSNLIINVSAPPAPIEFHDNIDIMGTLQNPHNMSLAISNHLMLINITQENQIVQVWNLNTTQQSEFIQNLDTSLLGTGPFSCNITALESDDYIQMVSSISFFVSNASLTITSSQNASVVQAYYSSMNNCSVLVSASLSCPTSSHTFNDATITCTLENATRIMTYQQPNNFSIELPVPSIPGDYTIILTAIAPHHDVVNSSLPLKVDSRQSIITFESNVSEAVYEDVIGFTIRVTDYSSCLPVPNKMCSIFVYNQSMWNLITQVILDQNGYASFTWEAKNVGDEDFRFKTVFQGNPEFVIKEVELIIINTHDIRFTLNSTIQVIRPASIKYLLQITTLDYQPLSNVSVELIEISSNMTWSVGTTNLSGYALLMWSIASDYALGIHEFSLIAQDGVQTLGVIQIILIVYEYTILIWV